MRAVQKKGKRDEEEISDRDKRKGGGSHREVRVNGTICIIAIRLSIKPMSRFDHYKYEVSIALTTTLLGTVRNKELLL